MLGRVSPCELLSGVLGGSGGESFVVSREPTVAVIGSGSAGIAAARALRQSPVRVLLVAPRGRSIWLPGTLSVASGDAAPSRFEVAVALRGIEVMDGSVDAIEEGRIRVGGTWVGADAVIAAPGLVLDETVPQAKERSVSFWDPWGAEGIWERVLAVGEGSVSVVIAGLPYRCPPAPFGLAMRLKRKLASIGRSLSWRVVTPEPKPLAALGDRLSQFVKEACRASGIEVITGFEVDEEALGRGLVRNRSGEELEADLNLVVARHRPARFLADLAEGKPLVGVDQGFGTRLAGVFVAGDAAASPFPRSDAPATYAGLVAAGSALSFLGLESAPRPPLPEPVCFLDFGAGSYARISISYPEGLPPAPASLHLEGPSLELAGAFEGAFERWVGLRRD